MWLCIRPSHLPRLGARALRPSQLRRLCTAPTLRLGVVGDIATGPHARILLQQLAKLGPAGCELVLFDLGVTDVDAATEAGELDDILDEIDVDVEVFGANDKKFWGELKKQEVLLSVVGPDTLAELAGLDLYLERCERHQRRAVVDLAGGEVSPAERQRRLTEAVQRSLLGAVEGGGAALVVIDCWGQTPPPLLVALGAALATEGCALLDTAVCTTGGEAKLFVGGAPFAFEGRAVPLFPAIAAAVQLWEQPAGVFGPAEVVACGGEPGAATAAALAAGLLRHAAGAARAEAMRLALAFKVAPTVADELLSREITALCPPAGAGASIFDLEPVDNLPPASAGPHSVTAARALLDLVVVAGEKRAPVPLAALVAQMHAMLVSGGYADIPAAVAMTEAIYGDRKAGQRVPEQPAGGGEEVPLSVESIHEMLYQIEDQGETDEEMAASIEDGGEYAPHAQGNGMEADEDTGGIPSDAVPRIRIPASLDSGLLGEQLAPGNNPAKRGEEADTGRAS